MKKLTMIAILTVTILLLTAGVAAANFGPHGGYVADTDACAACHRAHTATSGITWTDRDNQAGHSALLVGEPSNVLYRFCYVCHSTGAPGAATDVEGGEFDTASPGGTTESVIGASLNGGGFAMYNGTAVTSKHTYDGTSWTAWGENSINPSTGEHGPGKGIVMDCGSCHDPHGSSNYRILKDTVNGYKVGGYTGAFASDVDPDPQAWVISNEIGFPLAGDPDFRLGSAPTNGFRLHRNYTAYQPNYTTARYARGEDPTGGIDYTKGMSGWCIACHENYMTTIGRLDSSGTNTYVSATLPAGTTCTTPTVQNPVTATAIDFPTATLPCGEYDAGDGYGAEVRHRHPINRPLTNFRGERDLVFDPNVWQAFDPTIAFVDIPLDNDPSVEEGTAQAYEMEDWIECLTCHRAHGTDAEMSGYADATLQPIPGGGEMAGQLSPQPDATNPDPEADGVNPTGDSALLRADNRGVCERCHNK